MGAPTASAAREEGFSTGAIAFPGGGPSRALALESLRRRRIEHAKPRHHAREALRVVQGDALPAQLAPGPRVFGLELDHLLEGLLGFLVLAALRLDRREIAPGGGHLWP